MLGEAVRIRECSLLGLQPWIDRKMYVFNDNVTAR
jgi:hypothetical protein